MCRLDLGLPMSYWCCEGSCTSGGSVLAFLYLHSVYQPHITAVTCSPLKFIYLFVYSFAWETFVQM